MRCLVCGSSDLHPIANIAGIPAAAQQFVPRLPSEPTCSQYRISLIAYQCCNCTHVQIDAPLVPYYKDVISAASLSPTLLHERDAVIESLCEKLACKDPSIFEIGCFEGQYLSHLVTMDIPALQELKMILLLAAFKPPWCQHFRRVLIRFWPRSWSPWLMTLYFVLTS